MTSCVISIGDRSDLSRGHEYVIVAAKLSSDRIGPDVLSRSRYVLTHSACSLKTPVHTLFVRSETFGFPRSKLLTPRSPCFRRMNSGTGTSRPRIVDGSYGRVSASVGGRGPATVEADRWFAQMYRVSQGYKMSNGVQCRREPVESITPPGCQNTTSRLRGLSLNRPASRTRGLTDRPTGYQHHHQLSVCLPARILSVVRCLAVRDPNAPLGPNVCSI